MKHEELIKRGNLVLAMASAVYLKVLEADEELSWKQVEDWIAEQDKVMDAFVQFASMAKFEITNGSKHWCEQWDVGFKFYDDMQTELMERDEPFTLEELEVRAKEYGICEELAPSLADKILNPEDDA